MEAVHMDRVMQEQFAKKNFILFITLGGSSLIGAIFYFLTGQDALKTISMTIPMITSVLLYFLSLKFAFFEKLFPWVIIAITSFAALFNGIVGDPSIATAGIAFFIAGIASVHASMRIMSYGFVLSILVMIVFLTNYPYQEQIASSKGSIVLPLILMALGLLIQIRQTKKLEARVNQFTAEQVELAMKEEKKHRSLNENVERLADD